MKRTLTTKIAALWAALCSMTQRSKMPAYDLKSLTHNQSYPRPSRGPSGVAAAKRAKRKRRNKRLHR